MSRTSRARVVLAMTAVLTAAAPARGTPRAALVWERGRGAEGCVTPARLERAAERIAGRALFLHEGRADLVLFGRIERTDTTPRWHAVFDLSDAEGHVLGRRELHEDAARCRALDDALAVIASLLVDEEEQRAAAARPAEPAPRDPADPEIAPAAALVPTEPASPSLATRSTLVSDLPPRRRLELSAALLAQLGLLPGPGLGVGLAVRLPFEPHVELGLSYFAPRSASFLGTATPMQAILASASACFSALDGRRVRLSGCGGIGSGALVADASELGEGVTLHALVEADTTARVELVLARRLWLGLGAGVAVFNPQPIRYRAIAGSAVLLHRVSVVVGLLELRLTLGGGSRAQVNSQISG